MITKQREKLILIQGWVGHLMLIPDSICYFLVFTPFSSLLLSFRPSSSSSSLSPRPAAVAAMVTVVMRDREETMAENPGPPVWRLR